MNEKKARVLELMMRGYPITQISKETSVGRSTIYLWLRTDEEFKKAKKEAEEKILENMWLIALYELDDIFENTKDEYKQIQIFQQLAKIKGKEETTININKVKSVDEMIADLKNR